MPNLHKVFVYGTLQSGEPNNYLIEDQTFIGRGSTTSLEWNMYSLGAFPAVVRGNSNVMGELWEVDDEALSKCDWLECHPDMYSRERVEVIVNCCVVLAWMYIYQGDVTNVEEIDKWPV